MEKSTRLNKKRIIIIALSLFLVGITAFITVLSLNTRAPAYASPENYVFEVETGSYLSGNYVRVTPGSYPEFTLRFTGTGITYEESAFWYGVSDTDDIGGVENWVKLGDIPGEYVNTSDGIVGTVHLDSLPDDGAGGIIHKFMFFRGGLVTLEEYYVYPKSVEICLDTNIDENIYKINFLEATYSNGSAYVEYDLKDPNQPWIASPLTITVANNNAIANNAKFYYQLEGHDPIAFNPIVRGEGTNARYYGEATIPGEGIDDYAGEISIYSTDFSGEIKYNTAETLYFHFDRKEPMFTVEATVPDGARIKEYVNGSWTHSTVTYKIKPISVKSGARYGYYTDDRDDVKDLRVEGEYYVHSMESSGNITFVATSGSGVEYSCDTRTVRIDRTAPVLKVSAIDAKGTTITSLNEPAGPGGTRKGYASGSVKFTLDNDSTQNDGNTVKYEYASSKSGPYTVLTEVNGKYELELRNTDYVKILNKTYYFRITTASGLVDEKEFTLTVLDKFDVTMVIGEAIPNAEQWYKDKIKVAFTMPDILHLEDEYRVRRYVTNDNSTEAECEIVGIQRNATNNTVTYEVYIDISLNGESVSFKVVDKAGNITTDKADDEGKPLRTELMKLDLEDPSATIVATIKGSDISLSEDDWSKSEVGLKIIPVVPISGVNCYPVDPASGLPSLKAMEKIDEAFSTAVGVSGVYTFRLVSGAGRYTEISYRVNIDTSDIALEGVVVETEDANGNRLEELVVTPKGDILEAEKQIANAVRIRFDTNQSGHYEVYYAECDVATPDVSQYQLYAPSSGDAFSFLIGMPETGGSGTYTYAFVLHSKAKDANGNVSKTTPVIIRVNYDVRDFNILLKNTPSSVWTNAEVNIQLGLDANIEDVVVAEYQVKLGDGEWQTIDATPDSSTNYDIEYSFGGKKYYVNYEDEVDGELYPGTHMSYNGSVFFRALNVAGHPSNEVECIIRMDTSTPSPFYAVFRRSGEVIKDSTSVYYTVHSKDAVNYLPTKAGDGEFKNKAPITYYYRNSTGSDMDATIDGKSWNTLSETGTEFVPGAYYWLYAKNEAGGISEAVKVVVMHEAQAPVAVITDAGNKGKESGTWEFNWSDKADIHMDVTSATSVYFWYKIGSGEWVKINDAPVVPGATGKINNKVISFVGKKAAEDTDPFTIECNLKESVTFKITNLSGWEVELSGAVIVKIDTNAPDFDFAISTPSVANITEADLGANWYPEAINVRLIPKQENPSGVIYKYKVAGTETYQSMRGNYFSTDDIVAFKDGNGTVTVTVRAETNAGTSGIIEHTVSFKVDKVSPEFNIRGKAIRDNAEIKTLVGGEWTNADEVRLSIVDKAKSASAVSYTYWYGDDPETITNWTGDTVVVVKDIRTLVVEARSESGLVVTKSFDVRIDNIAPVIKSGKIVNGENGKINSYYIDQLIEYEEDNLKSATYNNYPLPNRHIIATNNVDNSNGGLVHIVVEDYAGNRAELTFYMTVYERTVNTITLSDIDRQNLVKFEQDYLDAKASLDESRSQYFATYIGRLKDRIAMLEKQVEDYRGYLTQVNKRVSFDLVSDYPNMKKYVDYFISEDPLIRYPQWEQDEITSGIYDAYYQKLLREYEKLDVAMAEVRAIQKEIIALPATNVVEREDYQDVIRVYNRYDSLSPDQKAVFKSTLYNKLSELKRLCEVYLLQDPDSGVKISGDHLVGETAGALLTVLPISNTSEKFKQAQAGLYTSFSTGEPTKIITIHQLTMEGYGSQYDTGEIVITLPIPSEGEVDYATDYVYFGVYRLSSDGSIIPVKNTRIAPDGKSISFTSTELGTFILATAGNVIPRPADTKIYGSIAGVEIDGTLLTYITYAVVGMFVLFVIIMILVAVRRSRFLRAYNRDHKNSLVRRGITRIPKGNPPPASNPARPAERVGHEGAVYYKKK